MPVDRTPTNNSESLLTHAQRGLGGVAGNHFNETIVSALSNEP
jgi:hypothetical protein